MTKIPVCQAGDMQANPKHIKEELGSFSPLSFPFLFSVILREAKNPHEILHKACPEFIEGFRMTNILFSVQFGIAQEIKLAVN